MNLLFSLLGSLCWLNFNLMRRKSCHIPSICQSHSVSLKNRFAVTNEKFNLQQFFHHISHCVIPFCNDVFINAILLKWIKFRSIREDVCRSAFSNDSLLCELYLFLSVFLSVSPSLTRSDNGWIVGEARTKQTTLFFHLFVCWFS